jgi:hypothetical protein
MPDMRQRRRRLSHFIFNLAAAVSLVLCIGTAAVWIASTRGSDVRLAREWTDHNGASDFAIDTGDGIAISRTQACEGLPEDFQIADEAPHWRFSVGDSRWQLFTRQARLEERFGFGELQRAWDDGQCTSGLTMPFSYPFIMTSLLPFAWSFTYVRRRMCPTTSGHCPTCGYDLRATPERCPECGTVPAAAR